MEQLGFAFAAIDADEDSKRLAISERLSLLERAADSLGVEWSRVNGQGEVAARVLRALGHLCGSTRQLATGITGLRWSGTWQELAEDTMIAASRDHVRKVARRLEAEGVISIVERRNRKGQDAGVVIGLEMARINILAGTKNHPLNLPCNLPVAHPGNLPVAHPGETVVHPYTENTELPKIPPPSERLPISPSPAGALASTAPTTSTASREANAKHRAAAVFETDFSLELVEAFKSIKLDRAVSAAREFAAREQEALDAIAVYRAQASKLSSPGAVLTYLRSGDWPVAGIKSLAEIEAARQRARDRELSLLAERRRVELARQDRSGFSCDELATLRQAGLLVG